MATGQDAIDAINKAIEPARIQNINANPKGVDFTISDGRKFTLSRKKVADLRSIADVEEYVAGLLA